MSDKREKRNIVPCCICGTVPMTAVYVRRNSSGVTFNRYIMYCPHCRTTGTNRLAHTEDLAQEAWNKWNTCYGEGMEIGEG